LAEHGPYVLVSGRWDNVVSVVDLAAALDPANHGTAAAIVARPRVTPDIDAGSGRADTPASGQPVNLVVDDDDDRFAYVVNHSGRVTPDEAAAFQHGHPGTITVLDLAKGLDPARAGTTEPIARIIPTGTAGPVGIAWAPDRRSLVVASAEADGCEDGGNQISIIDPVEGRVRRQIRLRVDPLPNGEMPEPCRLPGRMKASAATPTPTASRSAPCRVASFLRPMAARTMSP
jgi:hypothetical protein